MKNNRLSSVVFMWIGFASAIIATLMMFVPLYSIGGQIHTVIVNGGFFGNVSENGAWPTFIGFMLILIGGLLTGFLALPSIQPTYSFEKLLLIISSILEIVGIVLVMCCVIWWCLLNGQPSLISHYGYYPKAGSYVASGLALVTVACNLYAIKLDK